MPAKKAAAKKGKRYSAEEKAEILAFVDSQGRGGQSAAAAKYKVSPLTIGNWRKEAGKGSKAKGAAPAVNRDDVLRELAGKGFKIVRLQNALTGEIIEEKIDPKIEKLGLKFGAVPAKPDNEAGYVSIQGGRYLVTMTLDRLLALTGTKP
jgi:transposase-like protein